MALDALRFVPVGGAVTEEAELGHGRIDEVKLVTARTALACVKTASMLVLKTRKICCTPDR